MSNEHIWNANLQDLHKPIDKDTENGACLCRHPYEFEKVSMREGRVNVLKPHSCNHRWQAFKSALDDHSGDYNGSRGGRRPWYRPFIDAQQQRRFERVVLIYLGGKMVQRKVKSRCPRNGDWDITGGGLNYRSSCNRPFWHEAHHMIPNGALHSAIEAVGAGLPQAVEIAIKVRDGLLQALYNINHKINMVILPIEKQISEAILLPVHVDRLGSSNVRHTNYSGYVEQKLNKIFQAVKSKVDPAKHEVPNLGDSKSELEALSDTLRKGIKAAGRAAPGASLDESFAPEPETGSPGEAF